MGILLCPLRRPAAWRKTYYTILLVLPCVVKTLRAIYRKKAQRRRTAVRDAGNRDAAAPPYRRPARPAKETVLQRRAPRGCVGLFVVAEPRGARRYDNVSRVGVVSRLSARSALLPAAEVSTGDPRPGHSAMSKAGGRDDGRGASRHPAQKRRRFFYTETRKIILLGDIQAVFQRAILFL